MNKSDCCKVKLEIKNCYQLNGHPLYFCPKCGEEYDLRDKKEFIEYTTKEGRKIIAHKPIGFQKPIKPKVTKYYQVTELVEDGYKKRPFANIVIASNPREARSKVAKTCFITDIKLIEIIQKDNQE